MTQLLLRLGRPNMQSTAQPTWRDYLELCKPRVVLLMLLCALAGMYLASTGTVPLQTLFFGLLGIGLVAGSAAVINHIADAAIDAKMARTENRPIATGRVSNQGAIVFSAVTGIVGFGVLWLFVNPLTAWLNFASWVGYGFIYTMFLKRATPQNIVIGGLFGAAPPLFGWNPRRVLHPLTYSVVYDSVTGVLTIALPNRNVRTTLLVGCFGTRTGVFILGSGFSAQPKSPCSHGYI